MLELSIELLFHRVRVISYTYYSPLGKSPDPAFTEKSCYLGQYQYDENINIFQTCIKQKTQKAYDQFIIFINQNFCCCRISTSVNLQPPPPTPEPIPEPTPEPTTEPTPIPESAKLKMIWSKPKSLGIQVIIYSG